MMKGAPVKKSPRKKLGGESKLAKRAYAVVAAQFVNKKE